MKKLLAVLLMVSVGAGILFASGHYKTVREGKLSKQDLPGAGVWERLSKQLGIPNDEIGAVMFVSHQTSHGDRKAVIRQHPGKSAFYCFDCEEKPPQSKIVCGSRGKPPFNPV